MDGQQVQSYVITKLSLLNPFELQQYLTKRNDFIFLDARERQEYSISRIPTALHVGYQNFTTKVLDSIDRKKVMVVYCSIGYRSEKICEQIQKSGFKNVYNLYGGIFEWVNQGLPLHDNQKKQTNKIHAYDKKWGIWLDKGEKIY